MSRPFAQIQSRLTVIAISGCLCIVAALALSQETEQPPLIEYPWR